MNIVFTKLYAPLLSEFIGFYDVSFVLLLLVLYRRSHGKDAFSQALLKLLVMRVATVLLIDSYFVSDGNLGQQLVYVENPGFYCMLALGRKNQPLIREKLSFLLIAWLRRLQSIITTTIC